jgi:putative membrane protein
MIFVRWAVLAFAMWVATYFVSGIDVDGGIGTYLWVALLFGLINAIIGSLIKLITFPISIVTFGLFILVVNAAMLSLTDIWSNKLAVDGFWSSLFASLIISVITTVFKFSSKKVRR